MAAEIKEGYKRSHAWIRERWHSHVQVQSEERVVGTGVLSLVWTAD